MSNNVISSISICGEVGLNLHSLNNEGGEGNQIITRHVSIVNEKGKVYTVNSVSGDMLKHMQAEHLFNIAKEKKLPLCEKCSVFNANRISGDKSFTNEIKNKKNEEIVDLLIKKCVIDDLEGILITNDNRNLPRKSCAEFGWLIGLPDKVKTETYFHVKLVPNAGEKIDDEASNQGQNIFHRPASSGMYAVVANFDLYRISFNEITGRYPIGDEERITRYKAFMESIMYTFIKLSGAMRNTQNPHIIGFNGVIAISKNTIPAPTVSAISSNYSEEVKTIAQNINNIGGKIEVKEFKILSEFTSIMSELINSYEPYKIM